VINNKRQDYKIGIAWGVLMGRGGGNGEDESEGIWLMCFIYIYEAE
jgi:hypothetical protein